MQGEQSNQQQNESKKCACCNRKLTLTDLTCRCGKRTCNRHRLPEDHGCSFDYKGDGQKQLAAANQRVVGEKLTKL
jgi:predicted nucleic acid binding AN1-type Zn finger protein